LVFRDQFFAALYLKRANWFGWRGSPKDLDVSALGGYRLHWSGCKPFYIIQWRTGNCYVRRFVHTRALNVASRRSAAVKENYANLPRCSLSEVIGSSVLDSDPGALFIPEGFLCIPQSLNSVLGQSFAGSGLDARLVRYDLRLIRLVFHSIREVFGAISLLTGSDGERVSITGTRTHLAPLKRDKQAGNEQNAKSCLGPMQSRALEGVHLAFNLFEMFLGGWLGCFYAVDNLGSLRFSTTCRAFGSFVAGVGLFCHGGVSVTQKVLTCLDFPYYNNYMANVLSTDKQSGIIGALCEGSSIRSIERVTGVHRDTIMRLGVKVGQGCTALMDAKMCNLPCTRLECDEIWGFVGKKERHLRADDDPQLGNVWTYCAIDADTKLVPTFRVSKDRSEATTTAFMLDIADRMKNRVQISTDGLRAYVEAIDLAFGGNVDYGQIVKTYGTEESVEAQRRYSAPKISSVEKKTIFGRPEFDLISTSYVERLNATTRLHMKRLARLTHAFSKKRENFEAAVGLHFAYYNFVKRHSTLRCKPAMAAGVTATFWTVEDLVRAA
jgi:IS1 family transposase